VSEKKREREKERKKERRYFVSVRSIPSSPSLFFFLLLFFLLHFFFSCGQVITSRSWMRRTPGHDTSQR
jgi:hypothetical protein